MTDWLAWLESGAQSGNDTDASYLSAVQANAARNGQSPSLLAQVLGDESSFNPGAQAGGSTASGLGQILSGTASNPGFGIPAVDSSDPIASIGFTSDYLAATGGAGYQSFANASAQAGTNQTGVLNGNYQDGAMGFPVIGSTSSLGVDFDNATQGSETPGNTGNMMPDGIPFVGTDGVPAGATVQPGLSTTGTLGQGTGILSGPGIGAGLSAIGSSVLSNTAWGTFFVRGVIVVLGIGLLFIAVMMFKNDSTQ